jgi:uncharacterized protein YndB with AHSA1/START domain
MVVANYSTSREGRELLLAGVLNATPEEVFEAWIRPDQLAKWWSWEGKVLVRCEIDPRSGGILRAMMVDSNGAESSAQWSLIEVVRNERIVLTDGAVTHSVTLRSIGGRTRYAVHATADRAQNSERNLGHSFERLASLVEEC